MTLSDFETNENALPSERFEDWLNLPDTHPKTAKHYRRYMQAVCKFLDTDIDEIVRVHKSELKKNGLGIKNAFNAFVVHATKPKPEGLGLKKNYAEGHLRPLNKIFTLCGLPSIKIKHTEAGFGSNIIQKEQLKEALGYAAINPTARAIILTLKDSGLRLSDLEKLTIEDYKKAQRITDTKGREFRVWTSEIQTEKMDVHAKVHLGYESIRAVNTLIGDRQKGAIFLYTKNDRRWGTVKGTPMNAASLGANFAYYLKPLRARGIKVTPHSTRKFFMTNTTAAQMPEAMAKMICGKKIPRTDSTYLQYQDKLSETYIKVYDEALALDETFDRINELETEIKRQRAVSEKRDKEFDEMRETMRTVLSQMQVSGEASIGGSKPIPTIETEDGQIWYNHPEKGLYQLKVDPSITKTNRLYQEIARAETEEEKERLTQELNIHMEAEKEKARQEGRLVYRDKNGITHPTPAEMEEIRKKTRN